MPRKSGTNTLADGADGNWKACVYAKGHFEFKAKGTMNVASKTGHAISCKEYMQFKNQTLNITGAAKDGIHCKQYFWMQKAPATGITTLQQRHPFLTKQLYDLNGRQLKAQKKGVVIIKKGNEDQRRQ